MLVRSWAIAFGLLVGCGLGDGLGECRVTGGPTPTPTVTQPHLQSPPSRSPDPTSPSPTFAPVNCEGTLLGADRIVHREPARRTLYTWTTVEQIDALRSSKKLLANANDHPAVTAFFATLATTAGKDPQPGYFANARAAWPLAWATRLQAPGHRLLRIDLREEAYVVAFRRGQFDAFDSKNGEVPLADVIAHPERIGAIYFVQDEVVGGHGYREVLVGNEGMIEEWSSGTEAIRAELARERDLLAQLFAAKRELLPAGPSPRWTTGVVEGWSTGYQCPPLEGYGDALALPSADYEPTARNLARIIDTLDADPPIATADELVVRPLPGAPQ